MEARKLSNLESPSFQLSLRIRHPSIDPLDISRNLRLEAEHSFRAGEPRQSRSGLAPASVHAESYWFGILNPAAWGTDISFPGHAGPAFAENKALARAASRALGGLGWALSLSAMRLVSAQAAALLRCIRTDGGQVTLLVALPAVAASSFSLTPEIARIFSDLGITVEFELTDP